ncbi:hypothetical protein PPTG_22135 [Phytophthora nicotianae INRA-310]|uniref:Uncharacterized protein n=1 Tax=Phytophthora nicotianae (strain INRA-310) TaxID=761204 RepID=W2QNH7_PHYN3|nr:hypothetical protein PPTG_22135 [Phytophthora nicotianae INRA-310]ETN14521.1 hypothetical protein PPTG_22135 [Phytophthora nicotianae INRA-310]
MFQQEHNGQSNEQSDSTTADDRDGMYAAAIQPPIEMQRTLVSI